MKIIKYANHVRYKMILLLIGFHQYVYFFIFIEILILYYHEYGHIVLIVRFLFVFCLNYRFYLMIFIFSNIPNLIYC